MKLCFGDIVVVDDTQIGVVVKSWERSSLGSPPRHDVYVRSYNAIINYPEDKIDRYMVRHKYLNEEEIEYQRNMIAGEVVTIGSDGYFSAEDVRKMSMTEVRQNYSAILKSMGKWGEKK